MGHEKTCKNFNIYSVVFFLKNKSTKDLDDDLQFFRYRVWQTEIGSYGSFFSPFPHPPKNKKKQNFEKMEKNIRDIIILHKCSMMYCPWDMKLKKQFFVILGHFLAFYPTKNPKKSKFWKNEKTYWRYNHFTHVYQKSWLYAILLLRYGAWLM